MPLLTTNTFLFVALDLSLTPEHAQRLGESAPSPPRAFTMHTQHQPRSTRIQSQARRPGTLLPPPPATRQHVHVMDVAGGRDDRWAPPLPMDMHGRAPPRCGCGVLFGAFGSIIGQAGNAINPRGTYCLFKSLIDDAGRSATVAALPVALSLGRHMGAGEMMMTMMMHAWWWWCRARGV